ncbi:MAG: AMP-binding protein, partial [Ignavibacteriae bacterium]|nr:AMP-binding protein [Ignavibacteriota bacterium]
MTISDGNNNIEQNEDVFVFPTSYGQKRMWFMDQFEPGSPYYNIPVAFKIKGRFEQELFIKTINKIVDRHESIRTTFIDKKGEPLQVISPELKIDIPIIDLSENGNSSNEMVVKEIATKEARAPFNISTGPLFRVKIVKLYENENVVLITMHHIISDGWSMGVLVGEITAIYSSLLSGKEIELPELEIQYADFSEWQNEYLSGEVLDNQLNYWKNKLGNSNSLLELPTDRSRQAVWTNNGSSVEGFISTEIVEGLQKLSNSENSTLFMTLVASFNLLLHKYSGQDDINIGTPIANRTDQGIEKIIGLFLNTLVLRTDLSGDPTFSELLRQVRKTNLEAFEHQDLPFEMLVDEIQPDRNMSYAPLFQVMLILQNNPVSTTKLSEIELSMLDVDMGTATSDITYSISTGKNGASCSIEYNTDLFDKDTILRMFEDYNTLLKQIVHNPGMKISSYETIDQSKKNKILYDWNSRSIEVPKLNGIHSLVERWAEETPESVAVVDQNESISYIKLNEKSNQLAHYLIENNKDRNLPIGISLDKSVNLLITVLGVLKSGFAYLPLDPTYPEERLNYMIEDSGIELLISDINNIQTFSSFRKNKIVIEELVELKELSKQNPNVEIHDNDLAYIIYTSGSTGKAKGTMVQHNSLINIYLGWEQDYELLSVCRNHLQMASFSFDVFGGDWTRALCSGGKLVLVEREQLLEAEQLYEIIISENIDIAEFVPAVLRNLIEYIDKKTLKLDTFKVLIAGSDIWYVKEYNEFKKYCSKDVRLINSFGLTEAA